MCEYHFEMLICEFIKMDIARKVAKSIEKFHFLSVHLCEWTFSRIFFESSWIERLGIQMKNADS